MFVVLESYSNIVLSLLGVCVSVFLVLLCGLGALHLSINMDYGV